VDIPGKRGPEAKLGLRLLEGVNGFARPGTMTALMGSGQGLASDPWASPTPSGDSPKSGGGSIPVGGGDGPHSTPLPLVGGGIQPSNPPTYRTPGGCKIRFGEGVRGVGDKWGGVYKSPANLSKKQRDFLAQTWGQITSIVFF